MSEADRVAAVERIGAEIARPAAPDVDRNARFPHETLAALKAAGALGAAVPARLGGGGASLLELCRSCVALGQHCGSSAMILAMHHIQVLSIARHSAEVRELHDYLASVAHEQRLIASVTSEVGPSGDIRRSHASVERSGSGFELTKKATTISYGQYADDLLITAKRGRDVASNDQVLVLALRGHHEASAIGAWDTLGMRGTCSPGAVVHVTGAAWQILPEPFGDIATFTMVPASHVLWAACWLGIATDAVSTARALVRNKARAVPGQTPPAARNLSPIVAALQLMQTEVLAVARELDELVAANDRGRLGSLAFALRINNLKLSSSKLVLDIVTQALITSGIEAYRNDSSFSLGRHLRDACSASLMIHNDRLHDTNAELLLVHKGT